MFWSSIAHFRPGNSRAYYTYEKYHNRDHRWHLDGKVLGAHLRSSDMVVTHFSFFCVYKLPIGIRRRMRGTPFDSSTFGLSYYMLRQAALRRSLPFSISPCEKHMPEERPAPAGRATFSTRKDRSNKDKGNTERENHLERNAPCLSVPGTMQLPAKRRIHKGPPPSPLLNFAYATHFCPFLAGRENHALWVFTNGFVKSTATRYNLL